MSEHAPLDATLEQIKARWAKATPGPWLSNEYYKCVQTHADSVPLGAVCYYGNTQHAQLDAEAIAAAPTDVATLLAEVRRLTAENERLRTGDAERDRAALDKAWMTYLLEPGTIHDNPFDIMHASFGDGWIAALRYARQGATE